MNIGLARETIGSQAFESRSVKPVGDELPQSPQQQRALGPDLVRAAAALLVVYLHACVPYLQDAMPGLVWAVEDGSSRLVSMLFWSIEIFIMPLFLVIAGYFAYRSWVGGGGERLIKSRARRLLLPLLAAAIVLLPLDYYIWIVGWVIDGEIAADRLWKLKVRGPLSQHLFGLGHLWFLHYVFLYCVVLAAVGSRPALRKVTGLFQWPLGRCAIARKRSPFWEGTFGLPSQWLWPTGLALLPIFGAAVLAIAPEVVFGFQHAFLPVPSKWMYCGTFFFGGAAAAALDPQWQAINRLAPRLLAGGAVCGWAAVTLGQWAIQRSDPVSLAFDISGPSRVMLAAVTVAAAWGISLGILGGANRLAPALVRWQRSVNVVTYLAGASFWIYLIHHPLVALIQIDLKLMFPGMAPLAKSLITAGIAVAWSLGSYACLISLSRLGLRGERESPGRQVAARIGGDVSVAVCEQHAEQRRAA